MYLNNLIMWKFSSEKKGINAPQAIFFSLVILKYFIIFFSMTFVNSHGFPRLWRVIFEFHDCSRFPWLRIKTLFILLPIFLSLVCSRSEMVSGFLKRLLGNVLSPSPSSTSPPLPPLPPCEVNLNLSSKSAKSMMEKRRSSSNSENIVPRTCEPGVGSCYFKEKLGIIASRNCKKRCIRLAGQD